MGRGILSGVIWGGVFGWLVLTVLSLYAPVPEDKVAMVAPQDAPVESEAEVETEAEAETEATPETAEPDAEAAPAADEPSTQEPETEQPVTEQPAEEEPAPEEAQPVEDATAPEAQFEAPQTAEVAAEGDATQPTAPQSDPAVIPAPTPTLEQDTAEAAVTTQDAPSAPQVANVDGTTPAAPQGEEAAPQVTDLATAPAKEDTAPSGLALPQVDNSPEPDDTPAPRIAAAADNTAEPTPVSADTPIVLPVPKIDNPVAGVVTNRLPSVTAPASEDAASEPAEGAEGADVQEAALDASEVGALKAYAASYEGTPTAGQLAVILIDTGTDGMARSELLELGVPFSVAIDPVSEGAAEAAAAYRAAGIEVLAMPSDLPPSAEPSDVAVALSGYFNILNEAIAVMDPLDGRIQSNRTLLQPVLGAIRDTGHGLVTYDRGLNTAQQAARREGIAAATVFRLLDAELEEAPKIKRYLTRAAFNAGRDGSVVVVGRSYSETVTALLEWALDEKGADLSIVPVSQVMLNDLN